MTFICTINIIENDFDIMTVICNVNKIKSDVDIMTVICNINKIKSDVDIDILVTGRAKCDILLNNLCESFNSKLVGGRDQPIIGCLEYIRQYLVKRSVSVQHVIDRCEGLLTPTATKILETIKEEANEYKVLWSGGDTYQCAGGWGDQCVVNMPKMECTCRRWELTGIPCKHAIAAINDMAKHSKESTDNMVVILEDYVHQCYWLTTWRAMYQHKIEGIAGRHFWSNCPIPSELKPPHYHVPIGRPLTCY
jgi:hypothetical protein